MRVGIAGCGLIGGSLALALRAGHQVIAYDPAGTGDITLFNPPSSTDSSMEWPCSRN